MHPELPPSENATPAALLERTESWLATSTSLAEGKRVEVFHRAATRVRVAISGPGRPTSSVGREEGIALRLRDRDGQREGFAAAGCGPGGVPLAWLLRRAAETAGVSVVPWRDESLGLIDVEPQVDLPTPGELEAWLVVALRSLDSALGGTATGAGAASSTAWVEAALTVESLVHDGGLRASRSRLRVWAAATFRDRSLPDAPQRPRILAARRLNSLDSHHWAGLVDGIRDGARAPGRGSDPPLALEPEAAATLVAALVPVLHGPEAASGAPVGPGWALADDPLHPDALVGGSFDDAGFAARRIVLADEGSVVDRLGGPGCLRRPSYRDRPEVAPSLIVVADLLRPMPDDAWQIHSIRIHPSGSGSWIVEMDGSGGDTRAIVRGARLITAPDRLAAGCTGSFGIPRRAGWGVVTPGLILEGFRVEG